jgi:hypothetical protein
VSRLTQGNLDSIKELVWRLLGATTTAGKAAVTKEWSEFKLGSLPSDITSDLPYLTSREKQGSKVVIVPVDKRVGWWVLGGKKFPKLAIVARRLLWRHVTSCAAERNWSKWGLVYTKLRNRLSLEKAGKLIFMAGNRASLQPSKAEHAVVLSLLEEAEAE